MNDRGEILSVNQRWIEYIGRKNSDLSPYQFEEVIRDRELDLYLSAWEETKKLDRAIEIKLQLKSLRDAWEWFVVELEPDGQGLEQRIWIGTAMRLDGESVIPGKQQSTQFLEALLANASDGIVACDAQGNLVLFNRTAQLLHGLPPEPIPPEDWANYYNLYDADGLRILNLPEIPLFIALQGETVIDREITIKSKEGKARSLLCNGGAIYNSAGKKLGAVILMHDITPYKEAKVESLRAQLYSERLSIALRVAKAAAWTWDIRTQQVFWTPEFENLFDYEPGSTRQIYAEWSARLHPEDRERVETKLAETIAGQLSEYRCEYRIIWRDGQIRWLDAVGELHADRDGNPRWISGLVYDITERQQAAAALQASQESLKKRNEELDRFVYLASHDLKAPLRAIANLSEWIEEDLTGQIPQENQQQLELLRQRVKRMDRLIDGLLRYSRIGREQLEVEIVNVEEILTETIDSLFPPESFAIEITTPMPIFPTKKLLLSQIFANLIGNAIKHHNRLEGRIEITVEDLDSHYQFSIADDGPGISDEKDRERIFAIFQTLQPSESTENTRIGLAIVKKIVESEGGRIWLDSERAQGSRFYFTWLKILKKR
jgi:PAS domain S-box-containing protein